MLKTAISARRLGYQSRFTLPFAADGEDSYRRSPQFGRVEEDRSI